MGGFKRISWGFGCRVWGFGVSGVVESGLSEGFGLYIVSVYEVFRIIGCRVILLIDKILHDP